MTTTLSADVPRKIIRATGWDITHATVEDIHRNRAKFATLGIDGIHLVPLGVWPNGEKMKEHETTLSTRRFRSADFSKQIPLLKEISASEGLRDSMFRLGWCVRQRVDWRDDAAWAVVADNLACLAELAKETGFAGFALDEEDYYDAHQFVRLPGDPPFAELAALARRRGREVFAAAFRAHPTLEISSSWGFSTILKGMAYVTPAAADDQTAVMQAFGELWPCFLNGVIEAMPEKARFYEGNEMKGYHGVATRRDFEVSAWETSRGVLPQLDEALRGRYLSRLSVSFGQYLDMYVNPAPPKSNAFYYFPPKYGSRLKAFEENLVAALAVADRMVWVYGEKGQWIDWDMPAERKTDRSYRYPTWEQQLPGFARMLRLARGDFGPLEAEIAAGRVRNLVSNPSCTSTNGKVPAPFNVWTDAAQAGKTPPCVYDAAEGASAPGCLKTQAKGGCFTLACPNLRPGDELYVKARIKGGNPRVGVHWKTGDTNRWDLAHSVLARPLGAARDTWCDVRKRLLVPEGVDALGMTFGGQLEPDAANYFDDICVYRAPAVVTVSPSGGNDTPQVAAAVARLRDGDELRFVKGTYHFHPEGGVRRRLLPCGSEGGDRFVGLCLEGLSDVTVDGGGSTFVWHGDISPMAFVRCRRLKLANFTSTLNRASVVELAVEAKEADGFVLRAKGTDAALRDGAMTFQSDLGTFSSAVDGRISLHSLSRMMIGYLFVGDAPGPHTGLPSWHMVADAEDLGGGRFRFRYRKGDAAAVTCPYEPGERLGVNLEIKRRRCTIFCDGCSDVDLRDVTLRRGGGMGFVAQLCDNVSLARYRVEPEPGEQVSLTADCVFLVNCRGEVTLSGCDIGHAFDDAMNCHGNYTRVKEAGAGRRLKVGLCHPQQRFALPFRPGDRVDFIDAQSLAVIATETVAEAGPVSADGMDVELVFTRPLPPLAAGTLAEDVTAYPAVTIRDCRFHDTMHLRLSGRGRYLIENNRFERGAGLIAVDLFEYWGEAGRLSDMVIRNNVFDSFNAMGGRSFIQTGVSGRGETASAVHRGLVVTNNVYTGLVDSFCTVRGAEGAIVRDNRPLPKADAGRFSK